ncbi:serine hydrolase domain-containing protein [Planctomycetaceae bacterium SH248]
MSQAWEQACVVASRLVQSSNDVRLSMGIVEANGKRLASSSGLDEAQNPLFLCASITKLLVSTAVMLLVERGELSLTDRVIRYVPEFKPHNKHVITIHHLLSHTSGLPDTLPDDKQLRADNAPISTFFEKTCRCELIFTPGSTARYASMSFVLLEEVVRRITGCSMREWLHRELLWPLRMTSTWLGFDRRSLERTSDVIRVDTTLQQVEPTGDWNSAYWYTLGAPWGGLISCTSDLLNYCEMILGDGVFRGQQIVSKQTVERMLGNRLSDYSEIEPKEVKHRGWGLGWRLNWVNHRTTFSDLLEADVAGHWGATGTLLWVDRQRGNAAVILSNQPVLDDYSSLVKLSNALTIAAGDLSSR